MVNYREYQPVSRLTGYVAYYWFLKIECYCNTGLNGLRLPDHSPEWIFNISDPVESRITLKFKEGDVLVHERPVELFGIRFLPYGLSTIGGINMRAFEGITEPIRPGQIFPDLAAQLTEQLHCAGTDNDTISSIESILECKIPDGGGIDYITERVVEEMARTRGDVKITELCHRYNLSRTTLNNRFLDHIGISPKELSRIYRFNFLLRTGIKKRNRSLPELAHTCGYYDQSHLNREFKMMTGMTPTRFFDNSSSVILRSS